MLDLRGCYHGYAVAFKKDLPEILLLPIVGDFPRIFKNKIHILIETFDFTFYTQGLMGKPDRHHSILL